MEPTTSWTVSLTVPCVPTCPICGAALHPRATNLTPQLVTCTRCSMGNVPLYQYAVLAVKDPLCRRLVTVCNGLPFYTPVRDGHGHQTLTDVLHKLARINGAPNALPDPDHGSVDR
jgi:hypothetical protein